MPSLLYLALSNAVLATILAAFVAVLSRFCRRPAVRHALWLLVLLKLITPPLVPISVTWQRSDVSEPQPTEPPPSDFVLPLVPEQSEAEAITEDGEIDFASPQREQEMDSPLLALRAGEVLLGIWWSGAVLWWTVAAVRLRKLRRLLRLARPAAADVQDQGRRLAAFLGLRRCPPIVFVPAPLSPMLWALGFSPRLLVPAELWQKLTAEQQDTLLAHELAHLRRGDQWVRRLELLVLGLYWWHPIVWWAQRRLQEAEEECCDALVVAVLPDAAPSYAAALVETVAFLSQTRPAALVGASGIGHVPLLKRRLTMILTESSSRKPSRFGFWIVLGMGVLLLPLAPQAAWTEAPEKPQDVKATGQPISFLQIGFPISDTVDKSAPVADEMRFCVSCHKMPVHGDDFHGKSESWRHAHDEIVRLMGELHQRQAEFREALERKPAAAAPDRTEEIEKLEDEIELLKIQVRIKEAHVSATKATLTEHKRRYENYVQTNRNQRGAIPADRIQEVHLSVTTQEAQLQINEAELQESQIRLKQAERRLARLQKPEPRSEVPGKTNWNVTWAEALFDNRTIDFGKVKQGAIAERRFVMTNHGQYPVHIIDIRTSAGCVSATPSSYDLSPRGTAVIATKVDTSRFVGDRTFKVAVQFDKPDQREVDLVIRVNSQADVPAKLQSPERLQELEKKLDELRKEMDKLRREMRPDKPRDQGRTSEIPFKDWLWKEVGLRLRPLGAPARVEDTHFPGGMVVEAIRAGSPAQKAGFSVGLTILTLDSFEVSSEDHVRSFFKRLKTPWRVKYSCMAGPNGEQLGRGWLSLSE